MDKKDDDAKEFAQRLVAARMKKGWGPRMLAKEAYTYSCLISLYEGGLRLPTTAELEALANALGVRAEDLWPRRPPAA